MEGRDYLGVWREILVILRRSVVLLVIQLLLLLFFSLKVCFGWEINIRENQMKKINVVFPIEHAPTLRAGKKDFNNEKP